MKYLLILLLLCSCGSVFDQSTHNYDPYISDKEDPVVEYRVKITYCDDRDTDTVTISTNRGVPDNSFIATYKMAVPTYFDYINVCNVKVLYYNSEQNRKNSLGNDT